MFYIINIIRHPIKVLSAKQQFNIIDTAQLKKILEYLIVNEILFSHQIKI